MSLTIGSCAIDGVGNVTGSGLSADIANAWRSSLLGMTPSPTTAQLVALLSPFLATFSQALAGAIINHIVGNASVTITVHTTDTGLQTVSATPTTGPLANKKVTGGTIA